MLNCHDCDLVKQNSEHQLINAFDFYSLFKEIVNKIQKENENDIRNIYSSSKKWTRTLLPEIRQIVSNHFPLIKTENEYYRIDLIGYQTFPKNGQNNLELNEYFWNLELALEHENDKKDWLDEVVKLAHIKCGLKVIISYVDDNHNKDMEKLLFTKNNILGKLKYGNTHNYENDWLFIFGTCKFPDGCLLNGYRAYTFGESTDNEIIQLK